VTNNRRIFGAALLREFQKGFRPNAARASYCSQHFTGDMFMPPKVWGERTYSKLFCWNEVPEAVISAALEQPPVVR